MVNVKFQKRLHTQIEVAQGFRLDYGFDEFVNEVFAPDGFDDKPVSISDGVGVAYAQLSRGF